MGPGNVIPLLLSYKDSNIKQNVLKYAGEQPTAS